ncbi:hypothetical protein ACQ4M4_12860 [Leptolyngbya sp. AN02str]|uniref:hypothetical protein n=1 Tax=Leptolyngbya sp. AN02str TaxID=3423363 RepID=UPI003D31BEE7
MTNSEGLSLTNTECGLMHRLNNKERGLMWKISEEALGVEDDEKLDEILAKYPLNVVNAWAEMYEVGDLSLTDRERELMDQLDDETFNVEDDEKLGEILAKYPLKIVAAFWEMTEGFAAVVQGAIHQAQGQEGQD